MQIHREVEAHREAVTDKEMKGSKLRYSIILERMRGSEKRQRDEKNH